MRKQIRKASVNIMMLTKQQEWDIVGYIDCYYGCDQVELDTEHDKIIIKRYQSKPSFDDGGGLDAIDFDVVEDAIDLTQHLVDEATSWAKFFLEQVNQELSRECISNDDICSAIPYSDDDDDLPF